MNLELLSVLTLPFIAAMVLTGIHGYLGIHVLSRRVIFVDIALAQIAALGATVASVFEFEPASLGAYFFSLGFAVLAAAVFALTRTRHERVPQEAIIGLNYAIASSLAILIADALPHGAEHLRDLLAGSIVWVTPHQLIKTVILYSCVAIFHFIFRKRFLMISLDPERAYQSGINVRLWDFFFYLSFAVVITSSVQIAGVLLVFTYLIAPAVFAIMFAERIGARLAIAWIAGTFASAVGLYFSYTRPSGPMIICVFALLLMLGGIVRYVMTAPRRGRALALAGAYTAGVVLLAGIGMHFSHAEAHDEHAQPRGDPEHAVGQSIDDLLNALKDEHANVSADAAKSLVAHREERVVKALQQALVDPKSPVQLKESAAASLGGIGNAAALPALKQAYLAAKTDDEWLALHIAEAITALGDKDGLERLLDLAQNADAGLVKQEAVSTLAERLDLTLEPTADLDHQVATLKALMSKNGKSLSFDKAKGKFHTTAK